MIQAHPTDTHGRDAADAHRFKIDTEHRSTYPASSTSELGEADAAAAAVVPKLPTPRS